jgi:succinoglycan biosynthesis protein ExoM
MKHISVCICTYKRPQFLRRLLNELQTQKTNGLFTYSVVVADNDKLQSANPVVQEFATASSILIKYCVEPQQNIALARNKVVSTAVGDFIAFIDDDEFPSKHWLLTLFTTCEEYNVAGVLGPVKRHFDETPPKWVLKGMFYERPTYPTGFVIRWDQGRTGNVLLKKEIFDAADKHFNPDFRAGSDQDFFRRMIESGHVFIWCDEAVAYEVVPPIRWNRKFMLKRALLCGATSALHPTFGMRTIAKSLIAVPAYVAALPIALMLGQHKFMDLLLRLFDHLGLLLAAIGINPTKTPYITE